jgi:hypothetical protein
LQWEQNFVDFENDSYQRIELLKETHAQEMDTINQLLDRPIEAAKIKTSAKLKEMQINEKLVAVNERIEEAMNYRKELKDLEVKEAERVDKERKQNAEAQRKKLLAE